jgi:hypothetical protein
MSLDVPNIEISEETPKHKGIAWWMENSFLRLFKRLLNQSKSFLRKLFNVSVTDAIEDFEQDLIPFVRPFAEQILAMPDVPAAIKEAIRRALSGRSQAGLAVVGVVLLALGETLKMGFSGPLGRKMEAQVDSVFRSALFSPELLVTLWKRQIISEGECDKFLRANGLTDTAIRSIKQMGTILLDENLLTTLYWREEITPGYVRNELTRRGYTDEQVSLWFKSRDVIPSPGDLVSIAVREGFNDSIAGMFGYDENYPTEAAQWAEQGGMSQYFFKALWRAHWALPGLIQVRDMYHRGIVNESELNTYLLAADYPVVWRKHIKDWMYKVVTRVDARRMYDLGIWDLKRVYEHHLELGYNPQDAGDMSQWVALAYAEEERELTKTDILAMYRDGILDVSETTSMLENLEFSQASISLMLAHQELKRVENYERAILQNVKELYIVGLYDRQEVFVQLTKLNTPPDVIRQNIEVWDIEQKRKTVRPTVAQLRDMAKDGVISIEVWRKEMSNRRYDKKYIGWYEDLWLKGD